MASFMETIILLLLLASVVARQSKHSNLIELKLGAQWQCSFRQTSCGISNQSNMPVNFTWLPQTELFGEQGLFFLDSSNCKRTGARLVTPYFGWASGMRTVCLTFKYAFFGDAITRVLVVKQDKVNVAIWSDKIPTTGGQWHYTHIKVNVFPSKPARFFVEVNFNNHRDRVGFLAISEIVIRDSFCPR